MDQPSDKEVQGNGTVYINASFIDQICGIDHVNFVQMVRCSYFH